MKRSAAALLCIAAAFTVSSCGGGGGGTPTPTPPSITDLGYLPTLVPVTSAGGFTINGSLMFSDAGGDLSTLTLRITGANGNQVSSTTTPIQGIAGQTSGQIVGTVLAAAPGTGTYTIHVSVADSNNDVSNELSGPFDVVAVSSHGRAMATTGPGAASLQAANGALYWSETGTAALRSVAIGGGGITDLATRVVQIQGFAFVGPDLIWEDDRPIGFGIFGPCGTDSTQRVILRTTPAGTTTVLATGSICSTSPESAGIAVDGNFVYWLSSTVSPNVYVLNATPLTGGTTTTVVSGFAPMAGLTGDATAQYWMEGSYPEPGVIRKRSSATARIDTIASFAVTGARAFAVDASNVYYTTPNFPRTPTPTETLVAQPLAGGAPQILASAVSLPTKIVAGDGQVVWIDQTGVQAISAAGGSIRPLATFTPSTALDVLIDGGNVLWSETSGASHGETGAIKRMPLAGGAIETLVQGGDAPRRLALDAQSRVNWSEGGSVGLTEGFSRVAVLTPSGAQTVLSGIANTAPAFSVTASDLLIADHWRVKRLPLAGGMPTTLTSDDGPILSVSADNDWVYWNRSDRLSARKAPRTGGAVTVLADQGVSTPIASSKVQLGTDGRLYWVSSSNALVSVPTGGGPLAVVTPNASPCFVIDGVNAYFDLAGFTPGEFGSIVKQPLSGGAASPLAAGGSCSFPATGPSVLSPFVLSNQHLYWRGSIVGVDTISKVSVTGGRVVPVLIFDEPAGSNDGATSIAVDDTSVYWTYPSLGEIRASAR